MQYLRNNTTNEDLSIKVTVQPAYENERTEVVGRIRLKFWADWEITFVPGGPR